MIRYLKGTIVEVRRNVVVLDVHGVGYGLYTSPQNRAIATVGQAATYFITESIREDAHDLYGFATAEERDMFELVRKVSGVGPKGAMSIISFYSPSELVAIIEGGDAVKLSLVSGVGAKTASKIVVELKGRMPTAPAEDSVPGDETVSALQSLGYSSQEISQMMKKVPASLTTTNEKITWILQHAGE